ncbi:MAG: DegV family protein [Actinobacteria bacterium]|nr:DegV family protein [Actinomycetota bacterium]
MIGIVTDSAADIPKVIREKYDIACVPLSITFGKEKFIDGVDLSIEEFYKKMRAFDKLPTTAVPSPGQFEVAFKKMAEKYDEILSIHISEKMSGTAGSARTAAQVLPNTKITVVDSEVVHSPLGIIVVECAKKAQKNTSMTELLELVNTLKKRVKIYFTVPTLKYLQMGGRIGKAKGLIASALKIQPVLTLSGGEVAPFKTIRGWQNAKQLIIDSVAKDVKPDGSFNIIVSHADNLVEAKEIAEKCKEMFKPKELDIWDIGPVVGTHAGPGLIAAVSYENTGLD